MMLRTRDNHQYLNNSTKHVPVYLESVYQSPHFDVESQSIIDPKHLQTLIEEIDSNYKVPPVEKAFIIKALQK